MKPKQFFISLLALILAACAPEFIPAPTMTPFPTATSTPLPPTPTLEATPIIVFPTPSPLPRQPIIALTPDPTQLERWKEYEDALGKKLRGGEASAGKVSCEWEILGRSSSDVFVWALCMGHFKIANTFPITSVPAVIHLEKDGSVQSVEIPGDYARDLPRMFPEEVREKFYYLYFEKIQKMSEHLKWRTEHPEEPPLIVLSATSTP